MKTRIVAMILIFSGLAFNSCKDQDSKTKATEANEIGVEEPIDDEQAKLLDRIENYILTDYLSERDLRSMSNDQRKFQLYQIDLNNDGKNEVFVNFITSYFCGTGGCSVLLLNDQLESITEFTVTKTPIYVEDTMENGCHILMVQSEGKWRKLVYKNGSYPSNPSVAEVSNDSPSKKAKVLFDDGDDTMKTYSF